MGAHVPEIDPTAVGARAAGGDACGLPRGDGAGPGVARIEAARVVAVVLIHVEDVVAQGHASPDLVHGHITRAADVVGIGDADLSAASFRWMPRESRHHAIGVGDVEEYVVL